MGFGTEGDEHYVQGSIFPIEKDPDQDKVIAKNIFVELMFLGAANFEFHPMNGGGYAFEFERCRDHNWDVVRIFVMVSDTPEEPKHNEWVANIGNSDYSGSFGAHTSLSDFPELLDKLRDIEVLPSKDAEKTSA